MERGSRGESPEYIIASWERVAQAVREWESDILYDMTGFDDGR